MISIGVIMNPIESINPGTDSTLAMMDALQIDHEIIYIIPQTLHMTNHSVIAKVYNVEVFPNKKELIQNGETLIQKYQPTQKISI